MPESLLVQSRKKSLAFNEFNWFHSDNKKVQELIRLNFEKVHELAPLNCELVHGLVQLNYEQVPELVMTRRASCPESN